MYTETWILVQVEKGQVRILSVFSDTEAYFSFTLRPYPQMALVHGTKKYSRSER